MKTNSEIKMIVGIVVVCVVILFAFVWFGPKNVIEVKDPNLLVKADSQMTGKIGAKVTLVEFADYQCPACAAVSPYVKGVADQFKNNPDFNYVYRNFPLSQHQNAIISAEAAEAAAVQGKFWEMGEVLYKNQAEWEKVAEPIEIFAKYASDLKLNVAQFRLDLQMHKYQAKINADLQDAIDLNLNKTPSLFLNGVEVQDLNKLKELIEKNLAK